jgi:putative MFS transporter
MQTDQALTGASPLPASASTPARASFTANQWKIVAFCASAGMLETMDMYLIAFVLAVITGPWQLSFGESATILYGSGIGAVIGSFVWGYLADKIGRKKAFVATLWTCSLASVALAFVPTGNWILLAVLRAILGFGAGGFFIFIMLVQEFSPAARRGFASGFVSTAAACGLLLGALAGTFLMPIIGWRGMFALGMSPGLLGVLVMLYMPESPRWLLARGRTEEGRKSLAWALGANADIERIVAAYSITEKPPGWGEVFARTRSVVVGVLINLGIVTGYYGITLWAPTLLSQVLEIPGAQAAQIMVYMSLTGLTCRLAMGWLSDRVGRRTLGMITASGAAVFLVVAGLVGHGDLLSRELFWAPFALAFVLADSSFAIMGMYTSEIWPSRLRGRGSGVSYGAGSIGKIIGPLGLALALGSSNMIKPQATTDNIVVAFACLAAMFMLGAVTYLLFARETKGKTLEELDRQAG